MELIILIYLLLINALGFSLMLIDKQKAIRKRWRISETALLSVAALGGSLGSLLGMHIFHHKTLHPQFSIGVPVMLAVHIIAGILLATLVF